MKFDKNKMLLDPPEYKEDAFNSRFIFTARYKGVAKAEFKTTIKITDLYTPSFISGHGRVNPKSDEVFEKAKILLETSMKHFIESQKD